jgi:hypothetical protein
VNIRKPLNTYIVIDGQNQILYDAERPKFHFPVVEEKKKNGTLLKKSDPVWIPIAVELPTRVLDKTVAWIEEKSKRNISLAVIDGDVQIENWEIHNAHIMVNSITIGRSTGTKVIKLVIGYTWARRLK